MNDREIKQAIDVCRPDTDDPRLPEISALTDVFQHDEAARRLYQKTQQCDVVIGGAFRDVPVPDGLSDRLLTALGERTSSACESSVYSVDDLSDTADDAEGATRSIGPSKRRHWHYLAISLGTVAVSVAFCLVVFDWRNQGIITKDTLPAKVAEWMEKLDHSTWNEDFAQLGSQDHPLDGLVRGTRHRWCRVETSYDSRAVVYDLAGRGRDYAWAFCIRPKVIQSDLSTSPDPISTTGGKVIAVWQRGGMVYVMAVKGDLQRYCRFVESRMILGWNGRRAVLTSPTGKV